MRKKIYGKIAHWIYHHDLAILAGALALSLLSLIAVQKLPLKSDLASLLPDNRPSVVALRDVVRKLGGVGQLLILITPPDRASGERFVDALGPELAKSPVINNVDYRRDREFFEKHRFLFVEQEDLRTIRKRLAEKLADIKQNHLPFVLNSITTPSGKPRVEVIIRQQRMALPAGSLEKQVAELRSSFQDIEEKYKGTPRDEYYASKDHRIYMIALYPKGQSTDVGFARSMLARVDTVVKRVNEERFGGMMKVEYGGTFKTAIDDYKTVIRDVERATIITVVALVLLLTFMFRQPLIVLLLGLPQVMAVLWTFAMAYLLIGSLNVFTVFLFNILFGVGIEFGIQMYARYAEERRAGTPVEESLTRVLQHTWSACLTAAMVAGFAFFSLTVTRFKGFSEFGLISGIGIFLALAAMVVGFCPLVVRLEKLRWLRLRVPGAVAPRLSEPKPRLRPFPHVRRVLLVSLGVTAICGFAGMGIEFDYDLSKLKASNPHALELERRIASVFNLSLTPAAVIAPDEERLLEVVATLKARAKAAGKGTIDTVRSIESVIPADQPARLRELTAIRRLLSDDLFKLASDAQRREIEDLKRSMDVTPVSPGDIPADLRWKFRGGADGPSGYLAYVYPRVSMDHGRSVIAFSNDVSTIPTSSGTLRAASPQLIIGDMIQLMIHDGKLAIFLTFLAIFVVLLIDFRSLRHTVILILPVTLGVIVLLGVMAAFRIKFDFYNMIALPTILGLGIDNAIYLYHRYLEEGPGRIRVVLRETGRAVFITATAMVIGFSGLLFAVHPGLKSIGVLAVLGIVTVLASLLTFFPAFLQLLESRSPVPVDVAVTEPKAKNVRQHG
jgi:predicted RND superfamily exporter protein